MEDLSTALFINKSLRSKESSLKSSKKKLKYLHSPTRSNSDTTFHLIKQKQRKVFVRENLNKKNKHSRNNYKEDEKINYVSPKKLFRNIIRKNKQDLSHYIQNNERYLKLFGNPRYNKGPPTLFVEDNKKKISTKKMGLVPQPSKRKKNKYLFYDNSGLHEIQRNIAMTRRYQYDIKRTKKINYNNNGNNNGSNSKLYYNSIITNTITDNINENDLNEMENFWEQILIIQKFYRGYLTRKKIEPIINLQKYLKYFEMFLNSLIIKNAWNDFIKYSLNKRPKEKKEKIIKPIVNQNHNHKLQK